MADAKRMRVESYGHLQEFAFPEPAGRGAAPATDSDPELYDRVCDLAGGGNPRLARDVRLYVEVDLVGAIGNLEAGQAVGLDRRRTLDARQRGEVAFLKHSSAIAALMGCSQERLLMLGARKLRGFPRRLYMARVVAARGRGGQLWAQDKLGWNRQTVRKGLRELRSGLECGTRRGRPPGKSEKIVKNLLDNN